MLRAMRRVRRLLVRVIVLAVLVLGSFFGLDQWVLHAEEAAPAEVSPPPEAPVERRHSALPGPFGSPEACKAELASRSEARSKARAQRGPRIGTWNVRWFPFGSKNGKNLAEHTDLTWLACAIALLDVDVLAVQEFLDNPAARSAALDVIAQLDALTGGHHRLELDDCTGSGRQHVGLLWNEARVQLGELRSHAALNPAGSMCASGLRPGFGAHARFGDGTDLHVISVHLDSGEEARDYEHRARSVQALRSVLPALRASDPDVLVIGDYNAMGCDQCAPAVTAGEELAKVDGSLAELSLHRLEHALGNRCSHYYSRRAALLDLAAVSESLRERVKNVRADGVCGALACEPPKRGDSPLAWQTLSDHCPVVIELQSRSKRAR